MPAPDPDLRDVQPPLPPTSVHSNLRELQPQNTSLLNPKLARNSAPILSAVASGDTL